MRTFLHEAAANKDVTEKSILQQFDYMPTWNGPYRELDQRDDNGNTPIHIAAKTGNIAAVRAFLTIGANLELKNKDDKTPLDVAHRSVEKMLNGAPLICAIAQNQRDSVRKYIDEGLTNKWAEIYSLIENKSSPLIVAWFTNNTEILAELLKSGAYLGAKYIFRTYKNSDLYEMLEKAKVIDRYESYVKDDFGLHDAIVDGSLDAVRACVESGVHHLNWAYCLDKMGLNYTYPLQTASGGRL